MLSPTSQYPLDMLNEEERAVLEFEAGWWNEPGPKEQAMEHKLGIQSARYYEILRDLVLRPEASAHDPMTVLRVRRLIEEVANVT